MARLTVTMETIHAGRRRNLPPVPRTAPGAAIPLGAAMPLGAVACTEAVALPPVGPDASLVVPAAPLDDAQRFVTGLRSAAAEFATAAGAESAVVREAVPPARHRRARCRVVLRFDDGQVTDVTFLGAVGSPSATARTTFSLDAVRWLADGRLRDDAWLVPDVDAHGGTAVDLSAWRSAV